MPAETATLRPMKDRSVDELMNNLDSSAFKAEWMNAKATVTTKQVRNEPIGLSGQISGN